MMRQSANSAVRFGTYSSLKVFQLSTLEWWCLMIWSGRRTRKCTTWRSYSSGYDFPDRRSCWNSYRLHNNARAFNPVLFTMILTVYCVAGVRQSRSKARYDTNGFLQRDQDKNAVTRSEEELSTFIPLCSKDIYGRRRHQILGWCNTEIRYTQSFPGLNIAHSNYQFDWFFPVVSYSVWWVAFSLCAKGRYWLESISFSMS